MIYLASPYSAGEPGLSLHRFQMTQYYTAKYMKLGNPIFSPIVHCHDLATKFGMPTTAQYWKTYNEAFLQKADQMWILALDGWDKSFGVQMEVDWWNKHRDPKNLIIKIPE